jgi:hypothetical protein
VSARKIGFLVLILLFGATVEIAWNVRESRWAIGPEGCRALGGRFYGPSFEFEETTERDIVPDVAPELEVTNAFGSVRILPAEGSSLTATLRKVVFQPTEEKAREFARRVDLRVEQDGGRLRVKTNRDDVARDSAVGFETHLELRVPSRTTAVVRSDHGPVEAHGIASLDVRASFDDVRVENITGAVRIDVRQGMVEALEVGNGLTLKLRHGEADVTHVAGRADVDLQHGKLRIEDVAGLEAKVAFAEVNAGRVGGDVAIDGRRTALHVWNVTGRVEATTSFNDARFEHVGGDLKAKVDRGAVVAEDVEGALTAESTHGGVDLDEIKGPVEVTVRRAGLDARDLGAGARVRASDDDVSIAGSTGPLDVEVERGSVVLAPGAPITEPITVSAEEGSIRLEVPEGSRFDLEVRSRRDELDIDVPGLEITTSDAGEGRSAAGSLGDGGPKVTLTADREITVAEGAEARLPAEAS